MYGELTTGFMQQILVRETVPTKEAIVKTTDLEAFFDHGWNAHDVDALMTFMKQRDRASRILAWQGSRLEAGFLKVRIDPPIGVCELDGRKPS
jgi:hypothetical protein